MNVCVQCASSGSPEKSAAIIAARGASRSTLQPRYANPIRTPRPIRMPIRPSRVMGSALLQQHVEVGGGLLSKVVGMHGQELVGAVASLLLEHGDEFPFGIQLR